jgi:hypothetical protein
MEVFVGDGDVLMETWMDLENFGIVLNSFGLDWFWLSFISRIGEVIRDILRIFGVLSFVEFLNSSNTSLFNHHN